MDPLYKVCKKHGLTAFGFRKNSASARCRKCQVESVTKRRRKVKEALVQEHGAACKLCGYSSCLAALEFHHIDEDKDFHISSKGATISIEKLRNEAKKCVLLCCRCHREVHAGFRSIA